MRCRRSVRIDSATGEVGILFISLFISEIILVASSPDMIRLKIGHLVVGPKTKRSLHIKGPDNFYLDPIS